jgi:uncharacterized membrane protein
VTVRNPQTRALIAGVAWLLGLAALPFLPDPSPIHWDAAGRADGFGSPLTAALLLPAILIGIALLGPLLPRLDPRQASYAEFRPTYELFLNAVAGFLLFTHTMALGAALGLPVDMTRPLLVGLGLMIALMGNEMGRVQPNFFVGIRTPWTLSSPEVWRRTHRTAGRALFWAGLGAAALGLSVPSPWSVFAVIGLILGATLYALAYSFVIFRRLRVE